MRIYCKNITNFPVHFVHSTIFMQRTITYLAVKLGVNIFSLNIHFHSDYSITNLFSINNKLQQYKAQPLLVTTCNSASSIIRTSFNRHSIIRSLYFATFQN